MEPAPGPTHPHLIPSGYAEHLPPPDLREVVECFWTRLSDPSEPAPPHRVLPDGASDILFRFEGGGGPGAHGGGSAVGTMTRPLMVHAPDPMCYIGVRFRAGYSRMALGVPAIEITDDNVPLGEISRGGADDVDRVADAPTPMDKLQMLASLVRRRIARAAAPPQSVRGAIRRMQESGGRLRVDALAQEIGVSRQHLARQFAEHVGVSPKVMTRVVRVRSALRRASSDVPRVDWGRICHDLGYYDQSHFITEFRALVGMTPGEWSRRP